MKKTRKTWSGTFVCIFNNSFSKILLLHRNWEKKKREGKEWEKTARWGLVGGSVEKGETPLKACIREAKEEIGISLKPEDLVLILVKRNPKPLTGSSIVYFYATVLDENTRIRLNSESSEYKWFSIERLPKETIDPKKRLRRLRALAKASFENAH